MLVVDEHALIAQALSWALSERGWEATTCTSSSTDDAIDHARRVHPTCVLLGTHLRRGVASGRELVGTLASAGVRVVMLTAERRRAGLAEYLEAGAVGWVHVNSHLDEVDAVLRRAVSGATIIGRTERAELLELLRLERATAQGPRAAIESLTRREALVLGALIDGLSAEEIAEQHYVALTTVRTQIRAVLRKLGVRTQLRAVAVAAAHRDLLPCEEAPGSGWQRGDHGGRSGVEYSVRTA